MCDSAHLELNCFMKLHALLSSPYLTPVHLVESSPWPFLIAWSFFSLAIGFVSWLSNLLPWYLSGGAIVLSLVLITAILVLWWRDVSREGSGGHHTLTVQSGLTLGFYLFLLSEIMLFFSFFWAYFHSSLAPAVDIGSQWPPLGIAVINPWALPLLGSSILLSSGFILTHSHHSLIVGRKSSSSWFFTIALGLTFLVLQANEYHMGQYTIADSVFGSVFYLTTGLHALHVFAGVSFLLVSFIRILLDSLTSEHHLSVSFAILYWHLVDAIWLLVFLFFYWWPL